MIEGCVMSILSELIKKSPVLPEGGISDIYPLTPSQQTMYFMIKYSLHKQVVQIPTSFSIAGELDFKTLARAVNIEIERNDCMRLRFFKDDDTVKQYFLDEYRLDGIRCLNFIDESQMQSYFDNDASTPIKFFEGEIFRIFFFTCGERNGVYFNVSHLAMDAVAVTYFYRDLFAVYDALKNGEKLPAPMTAFESIVKKELEYTKSPRFASDAEAISEYHRKGGCPYYCGLHGPELLEKQRQKKNDPTLRVPSLLDPIHDKSDLYTSSIDANTTKKILDYCKANNIAPETLIQTAFRLHASHINNDINDTFMITLCSRRVTRIERNSGGCMAQPFMSRLIYSGDMTFRQTVDACTASRNELFRHKDFPYLSSRRIQQDLYGLSSAQGPSFMMYTWLPVEFSEKLSALSPELRGYNLGRYVVPMYAFSFVNPDTGCLELSYMYRTNTLSLENVRSLHKNAVMYIKQGIENPDITINELVGGKN